MGSDQNVSLILLKSMYSNKQNVMIPLWPLELFTAIRSRVMNSLTLVNFKADFYLFGGKQVKIMMVPKDIPPRR